MGLNVGVRRRDRRPPPRVQLGDLLRGGLGEPRIVPCHNLVAHGRHERVQLLVGWLDGRVEQVDFWHRVHESVARGAGLQSEVVAIAVGRDGAAGCNPHVLEEARADRPLSPRQFTVGRVTHRLAEPTLRL